LYEVDNEDGAGGAQRQPQHEIEGHDHAGRLGQLFGHDLGAVDHGERAQIAIAEPQQRREGHRVHVPVEEHGLETSPRLEVAQDEQGQREGPQEDERGQQPALRPWRLDPGGDLPPAPVRKVVHQEARQRHEVLASPR
ncbi:hypothetical protein N309_10935, partial [Tinamus guttatus]